MKEVDVAKVILVAEFMQGVNLEWERGRVELWCLRVGGQKKSR